jgi:hypothetical protein
MEVSALAMDNVTLNLQSAIVLATSLERSVKDSTVPAFCHHCLMWSATGMASVRWVHASAPQAGAWPHRDCLESLSRSSVLTKSVPWAAACTANVWMGNAFANKAGKDPTAKIHSVQTTALVMVNVCSSRCTVLGNASATMAGAVLVASGSLSMHS